MTPGGNQRTRGKESVRSGRLSTRLCMIGEGRPVARIPGHVEIPPAILDLLLGLGDVAAAARSAPA